MARVAIFSDIHGNFLALQAALADAKRLGFDELAVLGDILGPGGPDAAECVDLLRDLAAVAVRGNHDSAAADVCDLSKVEQDVRLAAEYARSQLGEERLSWVRSLPQVAHPSISPRAAMTLFHASPESLREGTSDIAQARRAVDLSPTRITACGHTHDARALHLHNGARARRCRHPVHGAPFEIRAGKWLLCPGAIGVAQASWDPAAWWLLIDFERRTGTFRRVTYDTRAARIRVRNAGLPKAFADLIDPWATLLVPPQPRTR